MIQQSTPVLYVEAVEPTELFFQKLGFKRTVEVPHGDGEDATTGFVIMTQQSNEGGDGGIGIMIESFAAAEADMPDVDPAMFRKTHTHLFMSVPDLDAAAKAMGDAPVWLPRRDSFYGATEIGYTEPGGNMILLAQFGANSPDEA